MSVAGAQYRNGKDVMRSARSRRGHDHFEHVQNSRSGGRDEKRTQYERSNIVIRTAAS